MDKNDEQLNDEETEVEDFIVGILTQAVAERASDVHIEPHFGNIRIRFRIDGILQDKGALPVEEIERIIIKMKVMSNMDITGHAVPKDGHFQFAVQLPKEVYEKKKEKTPETKLSDLTSRLFAKSAYEKIREIGRASCRERV